MSTRVRCFAYPGMISLPIASFSGARADNAVWVLKQPYLGNETLTVTASAVSSSLSLTSDASMTLLRIEVQEGKRVRYEVTPKGQDARTADQDSPLLYGEETIHFGPGWSISLVEDLD